MNILCTAKLNENHQTVIREAFPQYTFHFFEHISKVPQEDVAQAETWLTYGGDVKVENLDQMPNLKWIQVLSAGIETLPLHALQERNILLTNARGIHGIQMSEYTMAMILQLMRRGYEIYDAQKENRWDASIRIDEAYGKTIGIIGLGAIGSEIAKRAKAFGMRVLGLKKTLSEKPHYVDELYTYEDKRKLLQESDFVVVLLPLTAETVHFIQAEDFKTMKQEAFLINIARGKVIDEKELINALQGNQIAGAVLDVFTEEPLPAEHPLWNMHNVIITPHISGKTPHYMKRALEIFQHNLKNYPDLDRMMNTIDLEQGY